MPPLGEGRRRPKASVRLLVVCFVLALMIGVNLLGHPGSLVALLPSALCWLVAGAMVALRLSTCAEQRDRQALMSSTLALLALVASMGASRPAGHYSDLVGFFALSGVFEAREGQLWACAETARAALSSWVDLGGAVAIVYCAGVARRGALASRSRMVSGLMGLLLALATLAGTDATRRRADIAEQPEVIRQELSTSPVPLAH